jgi:6-phosphogluconolactonase
MSLDIEVADDPGRACSAMLVGVAAGGGHIVLTGGSTPRAAYGEFVQAVRAVGIDVSHSTMWFGDERCVPPDDERSNYGMAKSSLFDPLGDRGLPAIHRIKGELGPHEAAPRCSPTNRRCRSGRVRWWVSRRRGLSRSSRG